MVIIFWTYNKKHFWEAAFGSIVSANSWLRLNEFEHQKNQGILDYTIVSYPENYFFAKYRKVN